MPKSAPITQHDKTIGHMIFCPACKCGHGFYNGTLQKRPKWSFNGDTENPTFSPSMLVRGGPCNADGSDRVCHSFVRDGRIQVLNDWTHNLAGQTVDLPDV